MKLLLLPTERNNKTVRKGKFFYQCVVCWPTVGPRVGGKSADASVVCQPMRRWCVDRHLGGRVGRHVGRRIGGIGFFTFTQYQCVAFLEQR